MFILEKLAQYAQTNRTAVIYGDASRSYAELEAQSNAFAAYLDQTLGDDRTPIVICGHKQLEIIPCMFGALKTGRGYVPIDITFPAERVRQILEELQPRLVVNLTGIPALEQNQLTVDALDAILAQAAAPADPSGWIRPDGVAYILFTSGSTGKPKGVQITAGNLAAFHEGVAPWMEASPEGGRFLNEISYSFDVSVFAIYEALSRGMTLYTADKQTLADIGSFFELLKAANIDYWVSTPSLAEICIQSAQFRSELMPQLGTMLFCGEVLTQKLCAELFRRFPGVRLINAYGPTEATVLVTACEVTPDMLDDGASIPIGYAFSNVAASIVDPEGHVLPDGTPGELLVAGDTVSIGYLNRPELNERAFYAAEGGIRGYHTGDLCRMENGMIYYYGRLDGQVKINGFRVELEDVESNLVRMDNIVRAAVVPVYENGRATSLTAFLMLAAPDGRSTMQRNKAIRQWLGEYLPAYMIPRKFVVVDTFPLNTNGKIDKKALAALL